MQTTIAQRLAQIHAEIDALHAPQNVTLIAVSKTKPASEIREAYTAGQTHFGENYLQECLTKQQALTDLAITWHFIGPIQSNKTQAIAQHFSWVHSIDRLKVAKRLNDARPDHLPALQCCIQVNISNETTKSGLLIDELEALAYAFSSFERLQLRGLMAIPAPTEDEGKQKAQFDAIKKQFDDLNTKGFALDTLSMGMSNDYTIAIQAGSNMVRIGSKIFGARA